MQIRIYPRILFRVCILIALSLLIAVIPVSGAANGTVIDAGATVFIGEAGLNLTHAMNQAAAASGVAVSIDGTPLNTTISWWASGSTSANPDYSLNIGTGDRYKSFTVDQETFVGRAGNWYLTSTNGGVVTKMGVVMNVQDPQLSVAIWDFERGLDVTGMNVAPGRHLGIKITTNMYAATYPNRNNPPENGGPYPNPATDGYINIQMRDANSNTLSTLKVGTLAISADKTLAKQFVNTSAWYFGSANRVPGDATQPGYWVTDALDNNGQYAYPVGTYSVWAESTLNGMKDNYKNAGADYTGKTISATGTVTLAPDTVTIVAAGNWSYEPGDEIEFSGTNTKSTKTYLFLTGPNMQEVGSQIAPGDLDPRNHAVVNNDANTFKVIDVNADNTWSWQWRTAGYALDPGTYTIYAVTTPSDKDHLATATYDTVSIRYNMKNLVLRSIPSPTTPGSSLTIGITPSQSISSDPGWQVSESIPFGFTFVSTTAFYKKQTGPNSYLFIQNSSTPFSYVITAPHLEGPFTFSGTYTDGDKITGAVSGDTIADVGTSYQNYINATTGKIEQVDARKAIKDNTEGRLSNQGAGSVLENYFRGK